MGVSKLTGTPWHIEQMRIGDDDSRRHKSRCIYYNRNTGRCSKMVDKCIGSTYCENYKEDPLKQKEREEQARVSSLLEQHKADISGRRSPEQSQPVQPPIDYCAKYPIGSRVIHNRLGKGIVKSHDSGKITVEFSEEKVAVLDPKTCFEKGNLIVI